MELMLEEKDIEVFDCWMSFGFSAQICTSRSGYQFPQHYVGISGILLCWNQYLYRTYWIPILDLWDLAHRLA